MPVLHHTCSIADCLILTCLLQQCLNHCFLDAMALECPIPNVETFLGWMTLFKDEEAQSTGGGGGQS